MEQLETVIGLEVHAQMNTKSKMFCGCDNDAFGKPPNTLVCPVCMGHPGTLPVPNREAVSKALRAAAALKCGIAAGCRLDRKNYFYPDLPMGFQISQYDFPLAKGGAVEFVAGKPRHHPTHGRMEQGVHSPPPRRNHCHLTRLHIENDAGKLIHAVGHSYCDFNRAGTPLMEIVTEPDLRSPGDAVAFAKELRRILVSVNASDADMEKGMMRFDASISIRSAGEKTLHARSEIKNLNSFKSLEKALLFEEKRLKELWENGTPQDAEVTVHWDDERGVGVILREKESAADYRYFPEPDIPPLSFDHAVIEAAGSGIRGLPEEQRKKYREAGLDEAQTEMLVSDPRLAAFFDDVQDYCGAAGKRAASVVLTQLLGFLNAANKTLQDGPSAGAVIKLLSFVDDGTIGANAAKGVLETMVKTGKGAEEIVAGRGPKRVDGVSELEGLVKEALRANPKAVSDIRAGKEKAKGAIIGSVMGKTEGQADPETIRMILERLV